MINNTIDDSAPVYADMPLPTLPEAHHLHSADYTGDFQDHLLKQYELYIEMADRISARRLLVNTVFLMINITIVGALRLLFRDKTENLDACYFLICIGTSLLCMLWFRIIQSYEKLMAAKFKIVHKLEQMLPEKPFYWEWNLLGEGKDQKKYIALVHIEQFIPWIFIGVYASMATTFFIQTIK